jgi:tetratricopeptide (TPR) repeat protein
LRRPRAIRCSRARPLLESSEPAVLGLAASEMLYGELYVGNYEDGARLLSDLVARIREQGALSALPYALAGPLLCGVLPGPLAGGIRAGDRVPHPGGRGRPALMSPMSRLVIALIAGAQGRLGEAREQIEHASAVVDHGVESMITMTTWARGQIELAAGNYDEAIATLAPAGRFNLERGLEEPGVAPWAQDLAEAYLRTGLVNEAEATLEILERQAERTDRPLAHAGAERCRGLLAGDEDLEERFRRALTFHERVACPFERARTELCFGERLRRARRRSDARGPLRRALAGRAAATRRRWLPSVTIHAAAPRSVIANSVSGAGAGVLSAARRRN